MIARRSGGGFSFVAALALAFGGGAAGGGCSSIAVAPDGGGTGGGGGSGACAGLDEAACAARTGCTPQRCTVCDPIGVYGGCHGPGDPPMTCPLSPCPPPLVCALLDEAHCRVASYCHVVLHDDGQACRCAEAGCCLSFAACADGRADCVGPAICHQVAPTCGGDYVVSYANGCYEGCAQKTDCAP